MESHDPTPGCAGCEGMSKVVICAVCGIGMPPDSTPLNLPGAHPGNGGGA